MHACLVPSALVFVRGKHDVHLHFDYQGEVARTWIQGLPSELVSEVLKELRLYAGCMGALRGSVLLSHLDWEAYQRQSIPQRLAQVSDEGLWHSLSLSLAGDSFVSCAIVH